MTAKQKKRTKFSAANSSTSRRFRSTVAGKRKIYLSLITTQLQKFVNCLQTASALRSHHTSYSSYELSKPKRRAVWDLTGGMRDLEAITLELTENLKMFSPRNMASEKSKIEPNPGIKLKFEQQEDASASIVKLEDELREMTLNKRELNTVKDQNSKIQELENRIMLLTSENASLKSKEISLQSLIKNATSEICVAQTEVEAVKLNLLKLGSELKASEDKNTDLNAKNKCLEEKLCEQEDERRKLHNLIQELRGNIRVFCRIRPSLPKEVDENVMMSSISVLSDNKTVELSRCSDAEAHSKSRQSYSFTFNYVFDQSSTQDEVFFEISQMVQSVLDGYHVCIFAYGQTSSGKTYTMEGPEDISDFVAASGDLRLGMIPRSVHQLFNSAQELECKGWKYKMTASFLEIYNEQIRDMLVDNSDNSAPKCEIKRTADKGRESFISNVICKIVTSAEQVYALLCKARTNRVVAATSFNERSSRSHYIFQMKLHGENEITHEICEGILNLIDLAGSERVKESGSSGERLTEAKNINKSLSNLGNVIMALSQKAEHVPYRNSKLTHLLMHSLGGSAKTLMFVNISPCEDHFNETVNSLRFATKVNQCSIGAAQRKCRI